jgi:hypothetical protein
MISPLDRKDGSPLVRAQTPTPAACVQTDVFVPGDPDQEGYELAAKMRLLRLAATTAGPKLLIGAAF